ncbi:MAG: porin [Prevotella sp.]|nr:porin [Prevotella sp.]
MKKLMILALLVTGFALTSNAQEEKKKTVIELPQWVKNIKLSGYGMLQYQVQNPDDKTENSFNLRLMRLILDGKISDFAWRIQFQGSSNAGPGNPTVMLVDLFAEWQKYEFFRVKVGQFKRAFTFENPTHPITQGWYSYATVINSLSGFGDRSGEKASGGRDIGIQIQGDFLKNASGRNLFHYQIGIYNGEGINQKDRDNRKDVIGGIWFMPVKGVRIGAFGWTGSRGDMTWTDENGEERSGSISKNRYCLSAEYDKDEYTFRAEYIHSQGWGAVKVDSRTVDFSKGDKADGFYVFGIVPVIKSKLHAKARYNVYRPSKEWSTSKTMYEIGLNYFITKNIQINAEYALVNDRSLLKHNYNFADIQLDFKF